MSRKQRAVINLFGNLAKAATSGLSAAKPVDAGCGSCPDETTYKRSAGRRIAARRTRRYAGRR